MATKMKGLMNWNLTSDKTPDYCRPVLTDHMTETCLTPTGWQCSVPPTKWAYVIEPMYDETQVSINQWQDETFGVPKDPRIPLGRFFEEVLELVRVFVPKKTWREDIHEILSEIKAGQGCPFDLNHAASEIADAHIVLLQLARSLNVDLRGATDAKMEINRARKWKRRGDGCGDHE